MSTVIQRWPAGKSRMQTYEVDGCLVRAQVGAFTVWEAIDLSATA
jgi:hypothetical protein